MIAGDLSEILRRLTHHLLLAYPQGDAVEILGFFPGGSE